MLPSRRLFLQLVSLGVPIAAVSAAQDESRPLPTLFPTQAPELVQEMVVVAHGNIARVQELVGRHPALAKATWDWGFGDWETALGAASHVGRTDIAEVLLANGAHPTIFSAAMLGQVDVVKAFVVARPGIERTKGPHSIPLWQHAVAGGARAQAVVEYLKTIDGAQDRTPTQPLSDEEIAKLVGVYVFGITPADRFEVTAANKQLQVGRPGHYARGLYHLGNLEFYPMGAESVRIRFLPAAEGVTLGVYDPDLVITARLMRKT